MDILDSTNRLFYSKNEVKTIFTDEKWQRIAFEEFSERISGSSQIFPCTFGTNGFLKDHIRYSFLDFGYRNPCFNTQIVSS